MYTRCPDCETAFRVTARVLQQAAGQVRCGRCSHAFNALERLSEDPPDGPPSYGSPKSRARMLQTLDELSGPGEIRIEDTGVEWRVIDEDTVDDGPPDASGTEDEGDGTSVRWYIEDTGREPARSDADAAIPEISDEVPGRDDGHRVTPDKPQQPLPLDTAGDEGNELRYDDNTPLPEDFADEIVLVETPRRRAEDHIAPRSAEFDELQVDLALGEPGEWMELLDELGANRSDRGEAAEDVADGSRDASREAPEDTGTHAFDDHAGPPQEPRDDLPNDIDTQFDLQALEMGIDLTGNRELQDDQDTGIGAGIEADSELEQVTDADTDSAPGVGDDGHAPAADAPQPAADDDEADIELELAADADDTETGEPEVSHDADEADVAEASGRSGEQPEAGADAPPLSEEEMTINRLIDQDLMRYAEEQEDFAATGAGERQVAQAPPHVETIIMEGDFVRHAFDDTDSVTPKQPDSRPGPAEDEAEPAMDPWLASKEPLRRGRRRTDPPAWGVIAGIAALGLVLLVQVVHAYRGTLATNGAFDRTVGAVYRLFGEPVVPDWDVKGWQFQTTSGGTDENNQTLRISSRLANRSGGSLPYPLMYVSLTDRWEETVGASVLQPREYLAEGVDAAAQVPAGETFSALITIQSLSPEATGFKLYVCYPARDGQLRCAIEDFRN